LCPSYLPCHLRHMEELKFFHNLSKLQRIEFHERGEPIARNRWTGF
jgi:hypothetical protein